MNFSARERQRLVALRDGLFEDPGAGLFAGMPRDFVLRDAAKNLWPGIREDAIAYFARNAIAWWNGTAEAPTGHLLSSQMACVNHLYPLRQRPDLTLAVLRALDPQIVVAERVDDGYVAFEFIGERPYLAERGFSRGAHCTSVDAVMIGRTAEGGRRAFLIEWKYTETYGRQDKYIPARARVYDHLIHGAESPFRPVAPGTLYFEPFYQLMRQALLGWQVARHRDHGCCSYRHVHVVPAANEEFHRGVTAPGLAGATVSEAWTAILREAGHYLPTTPADIMRPILAAPDTGALAMYLEQRYWRGG